MFHVEKQAGSKTETYANLLAQAEALLAEDRDWLANLSNLSALIYSLLPDLNWAGVYLLKQGELVLGPFQGKPACIRIPVGQGVCGTAVAQRKAQVVPDVDAFPGHIACDTASRSEVVIPIFVDQDIVGVLDIDSPLLARFDDEDRKHLEALVELAGRHIDWLAAIGRR